MLETTLRAESVSCGSAAGWVSMLLLLSLSFFSSYFSFVPCSTRVRSRKRNPRIKREDTGQRVSRVDVRPSRGYVKWVCVVGLRSGGCARLGAACPQARRKERITA